MQDESLLTCLAGARGTKLHGFQERDAEVGPLAAQSARATEQNAYSKLVVPDAYIHIVHSLTIPHRQHSRYCHGRRRQHFTHAQIS